MGIFEVFREKFTLAGQSLPIGSGFISQGRDIEESRKFDYGSMVKLGNDERIHSLFVLCASIAHASYRGIYIRPKDVYTDSELEKAEIDCVNEAIKFCEDYNIQDMFYAAAWNVIQFGDYVEVFSVDSSGVTDVMSLPIDRVTIVEEMNQLNKSNEEDSEFITEKNIYVINEDEENHRKTYLSDSVVHVSFNSRGQYRRDKNGRLTYGVWSKPPIYVLNTLVDWKRQSIVTDIKWKRRSVPREHWKLDVNTVTPDGFEGTKDEKIAKATEETTKILDGFKSVVDQPQPDQSVITTSSVECDVLEPKSTTYNDPNETIRQINGFLGTPLGVPEAFLGGKIESFAGTTMSALFSEMRMDVLCKKIAKEYEKMVRAHVAMVYPKYNKDGDSVVNRLKIRVDSSLNQVLLEKTRVAMMMVGMGLFTKEEIRGVMGYSGIAQNPYEKDTGDEIRDGEGEMVEDASRVTNGVDVNNKSPSAQQNVALGRGVRDDKVGRS